MIFRHRLWRFHKYRENDEFCPLCGEPIRWIYDREKGEWAPCDRKPVMYITDVRGVQTDLYSAFRKPVKGVLYNTWDKRFTRERVKNGYVPHVYVCTEENQAFVKDGE